MRNEEEVNEEQNVSEEIEGTNENVEEANEVKDEAVKDEESEEVVKEKKPKKKTKKKTTKKKATKKKTAKKKTTKKRGRPKKVKNEEEKEDDVSEDIEENIEEANTQPQKERITNSNPTKWILNKQMQFGLVNEKFEIGTVFDVDWENHCMRCESNGLVYNNTRDLEIAIRIGVAEPCNKNQEEYQRMQAIASAAKESENKKLVQSREYKDNEIRNKISRSDQDVVNSIDISHTKKQANKNNTEIKVTPNSEVSVMKPEPQKREMQVHYSDGAQEGRLVRSSNSNFRNQVENTTATGKPLSPVLSGKNNWNVKSSGQIKSEIEQKLRDSSIITDENGQQYIRGLPVIRDDSDVGMGSGSSLNEGMTTLLSDEQKTERARRIQEIRNQRKSSIVSNQNNPEAMQNNVINNVSSQPQSQQTPQQQTQQMMPQNLSAGMGVSDDGVTQIEQINLLHKNSKPEENKSIAKKLLRRRK